MVVFQTDNVALVVVVSALEVEVGEPNQ